MDFEEFKKKYQKVGVEEFPNNVPNEVLVSVLVQTYNHENYIRECLESIISQKTDFSFEILLGEDFSSDKTREICIEYANQFPGKIRLFLHRPENKIKVQDITTGNFNAFYNLYNARGKFIAFCEGDDYWTDDLKLQKQVGFLEENPQFVMCYHEFLNIDETNKIIPSIEKTNQPKFDISKKNLINTNYHPLLFTVCFRNRLKSLPQEAFQVINVDTFIISLLGNHGQAKFLDMILPSYYRKHFEGIWSKGLRSKNLKSKIHTYQKISSYYNSCNNLKISKSFNQKSIKFQKMLIWSLFKQKKVFQFLQSIFTYTYFLLKEIKLKARTSL